MGAKYELRGDVAVITLDNPPVNGLGYDTRREFSAGVDRALADPAIAAIVITGAGKAFCAGMDLSVGGNVFGLDETLNPSLAELEQRWDDPVMVQRVRDTGGRVSLAVYECRKPVIGAINGAAVGIGATMTLPMDIRLASTEARIGFVFSRRGIVMEAASSWFLPRLVGPQQALEWVYSGRVFDAAEAHAGRLVRSVLPPDQLLPEARKIAKEIVDNTSPVAVALMRQMVWRMMGADDPMEAHKIDSRGIFERGRSADVKEGVMSFLEKRAPKFPDKVSKDMPPYFPWWEERGYK